MGNFGTKPAGDRRPAILFRSVCDRETKDRKTRAIRARQDFKISCRSLRNRENDVVRYENELMEK